MHEIRDALPESRAYGPVHISCFEQHNAKFHYLPDLLNKLSKHLRTFSLKKENKKTKRRK